MNRVLEAYRRAYSGLPKSIWLLSFVAFVNRCGTMVLPFLALYISVELGASTIQAGFVISLWGVGAVGGGLLGGWISDRLGTTTAQFLSLFLGGFAFLALGWVSDYWSLAVCATVGGLVVESFRPAVMAAVAEAAPPEMTSRAVALLRLAINLGMTVGPAVGGILATIDYSWLFIVDAATCWAASVVVLLFCRSGTGVARKSATAGSSPFADRPFLLLLALNFVVSAGFFQLFATVPLYYREAFHMSEARIGSIFAVNTVIIVLFEMVLLQALEKRSKALVAGTGALLVGLGFGIMPLGGVVGFTWGFAIVTVVIWTAGEMLAFPVSTAIAAERGIGRQGRYMGLYATVIAISQTTAPVVGAWVYQTFGPEWLWIGLGASCLAVLPGYVVLSKKLRPSP